MALPRAIHTLLGAVRVVKGFPWWLQSPPTESNIPECLDFGNTTFFALAPALGAHCSCAHALRCVRTRMNLRSIRAVLLLCAFTDCSSDHKVFLQRAFPVLWESPTFCSCTPRHSACAVPNGTARSFCRRDGVNCPMSTRARVQVAMSTSTGHLDCAWRVTACRRNHHLSTVFATRLCVV